MKQLYQTSRRFSLCKFCKEPLTAGWTKGNSGMYAKYYCHKKGCKMYSKTISKKDFEEYFFDYLRHHRGKQKFIDFFDKVFRVRYQERLQKINGDYLRKMDDINELQQQQEWLVEKGSKDIIPDNLLEKQLIDIKQKITLAKIGLTELHSEELDIDALLNYAYAFIKTLI